MKIHQWTLSLVIALFCNSAHARLEETREGCDARYGTPEKYGGRDYKGGGGGTVGRRMPAISTNLESTLITCHYKTNDFIVQVTFISNIAVGVHYRCKSLEYSMLTHLLDVNAQGSTWNDLPANIQTQDLTRVRLAILREDGGKAAIVPYPASPFFWDGNMGLLIDSPVFTAFIEHWTKFNDAIKAEKNELQRQDNLQKQKDLQNTL